MHTPHIVMIYCLWAEVAKSQIWDDKWGAYAVPAASILVWTLSSRNFSVILWFHSQDVTFCICFYGMCADYWLSICIYTRVSQRRLYWPFGLDDSLGGCWELFGSLRAVLCSVGWSAGLHTLDARSACLHLWQSKLCSGIVKYSLGDKIASSWEPLV